MEGSGPEPEAHNYFYNETEPHKNGAAVTSLESSWYLVNKSAKSVPVVQKSANCLL
jgi:hypothetical protein